MIYRIVLENCLLTVQYHATFFDNHHILKWITASTTNTTADIKPHTYKKKKKSNTACIYNMLVWPQPQPQNCAYRRIIYAEFSVDS